MDIEQAREYCLEKRGTEESLPFDQDTLVFKVCGKIFAVIALEKPDSITLKINPALGEAVREHYAAVTAAPYFNKHTWVRVLFGKDLDDEDILSLIDHAYGETLRGMTKKKQLEFFTSSLGSDTCHLHRNTCQSTMEECRTPEAPKPGASILLVTTDLQKEGRGQRGNHWESENGKNLLFSLAFEPRGISAARQFLLSQAVSLAAVLALRSMLPRISGASEEKLSIKWPNDIYYEDKKLGGILLEHTVEGNRISRTTAGVGLNINQHRFLSDAPNPLSLQNILGYELPRYLILEKFLVLFREYLCLAESPERIKKAYMPLLYRRDGLHPFRDGRSTFLASIEDVLPDGRLALRRDDGTLSLYSFKEVEFIQDPA